MAEAVGLAAGILAFVELGAKVAKVLTQYCVEVYHAPKELRKLSAELHSINMIGNLMKAHRDKIEETLCNTDIEMLLSTRLKAWKDSMRKLTEFLNKMLSSGPRGSTFTNWKALILPFTSTIEKRTEELKELKIDFIFILQLSNE
jgi:hypothetical protein